MLLKQNLSLTLSSDLVKQVDILKLKFWISRSETIERLIKESLEKQLLEDAEILASMDFDDLPTEDEWISIQNN